MINMALYKVIDDDLMCPDEQPHGVVPDDVFVEVVLAADAAAAIAAAFQSGMDQMIGGIEQTSYDRGQRDVFSPHPQWAEGGMCSPGCLPCKRLTELIKEREVGYHEGYGAAMDDGWGEPGHIKAALDAAVQRVGAAVGEWGISSDAPALVRIIEAIKGDQP